MINRRELNQLFEQGWIKLPQLKLHASEKSEILAQTRKQSSTYRSSTLFHLKYLADRNIHCELIEPLRIEVQSRLGFSVDENDVYTITRTVFSRDYSEFYRGHFDSHLFTLVTPANIPMSESFFNGQLLLFPNIRKEPRNEIKNLIDKIRFATYSSAKGASRLAKKTVPLVFDFSDGAPVLFLGRRSFHLSTEFRSSDDSPRITILTHIFDPSPSWGVGRMLRILRAR